MAAMMSHANHQFTFTVFVSQGFIVLLQWCMYNLLMYGAVQKAFCSFHHISFTGAVLDVKISGDRVITCGEDGTFRVWDSWTNHCIKAVLAHVGAVCSIALRQIPGLYNMLQISKYINYY